MPELTTRQYIGLEIMKVLLVGISPDNISAADQVNIVDTSISLANDFLREIEVYEHRIDSLTEKINQALDGEADA